MLIQVITVSREAGSAGDAVGYELARRLGFICINRAFVDLIARKARVAPWQVERIERAAPVPRLADESLLEPTDDEGPALEALVRRLGYGERMTSDEYLTALRGVVGDLAELGGMVLMGRGGQLILRGRPDAFHVRVMAPRDERISELARMHGVTWSEAEATAERIDGLRHDLLRALGDEAIDDSRLYDVVVNTSWKTVDECVDEILRAMGTRQPATDWC